MVLALLVLHFAAVANMTQSPNAQDAAHKARRGRDAHRVPHRAAAAGVLLLPDKAWLDLRRRAVHPVSAAGLAAVHHTFLLPGQPSQTILLVSAWCMTMQLVPPPPHLPAGTTTSLH